MNVDIIERPLARMFFAVMGKLNVWNGLDPNTRGIILVVISLMSLGGLAFFIYRLGSAHGDGFSGRRVFWAMRKPLIAIVSLIAVWSVLIASR